MTGYVTMCDGRRSALPALLQWDIKLTDGDPCDGFSVCFPYERALAQTLRGAVFFTAEEDGATVFTGVVDDYEITLDAKGLLAEMTGRGMAARLLDNQVRAAEYLSAQLADILKSYVLPYGVTKLRTSENATVVITHYQRLLDYIVPDFVHVLYKGRIIYSGDRSLALKLEKEGYDWLINDYKE